MQLSPRDRRMLMILGVVVVGAALLYFFVLSGHKGTKSASSSGPAPITVQPGSSPAVTPSPGPTPILVFAGRDPFAAPPGALIGVASPAASGPTVAPAGSGGSTPGGGSSATVGGKTVVLDSVFTLNGTEEVQVEVSGTVYTVAVGDTFATNYALASINGSCADFTYKTTTSFTLCVTANK
jgi:hypothetical protein